MAVKSYYVLQKTFLNFDKANLILKTLSSKTNPLTSNQGPLSSRTTLSTWTDYEPLMKLNSHWGLPGYSVLNDQSHEKKRTKTSQKHRRSPEESNRKNLMKNE